MSRIDTARVQPPQRAKAKLVAVLLVIGAALASGCTYYVDSTADAPDVDPGDFQCATNSGTCTLRAAIMEANATAIAERIEIPAGNYSLTLPANAGGGPLVIASNVQIRGAGASSTIVDAAAVEYDGGLGCPDSGSERQAFRIDAGTVSIGYLTAQGGFGQNGGGILVNAGTVEINDAVVRRNVAYTGGGGLYVRGGIVNVRRTSILENCATGVFGGGIRTAVDTQLWVYDSLIARNSSNRAGGIRNLGAMNLRSTTVSGNVATSPLAGTGGISQIGFAVLNNVTLTNNVGLGTDPGSFLGGGIQSNANATTVVKNSIIAGNDGQGGPNDCAGPLTFDSKYNLIGDSNGCELSGFLFTYLLDVDPQLNALASNGGSTQTHSLSTGSPAREAAYQFPPPAADACELRDQRGVPRPQGSGRCDMGAFEAGNANTFVTSFVLVDADTDADLFTLRNGELLNLDALPPNVSVRAEVSGAAGSVVFALDANASFQVENNPPFALGGDNPAGNYQTVPLTAGEHIVRATPFAGENGTGAAGGSLEAAFTVIAGE
jgi:CSLREA domain-containing protein